MATFSLHPPHSKSPVLTPHDSFLGSAYFLVLTSSCSLSFALWAAGSFPQTHDYKKRWKLQMLAEVALECASGLRRQGSGCGNRHQQSCWGVSSSPGLRLSLERGSSFRQPRGWWPPTALLASPLGGSSAAAVTQPILGRALRGLLSEVTLVAFKLV